MKALKIIGTLSISFILAIIITFFIYTSFIDTLNIRVPEKPDFIHPSRLLMKYEVFISGIVLRHRYHSFVRQLNLTGNEAILDFGSGSGGEAIHLAELIQGKNGRLTCLDISQSWLRIVKHRLSGYRRIDYIEGDILRKDIPSASFNAIILRLVLHDIPHAQRKPIIDIFHTILRPGGSVYILEPIGKNHAIDEKEMRSLFKDAGFQERYFTRSFSFVMIPPRSMGMAAYDKKR